MSIYLSGIQPTGKLHIGNYFGCIKPFLSIKTNSLNRNNKNIFLIADMHCYTKPKRISNVSNQVFEAVRSLLAAGVNPETTIFVRQSRVFIV
jgi:tryptophanyl-tRNA synthetase